jgi:hypothetical protein
MKLNTGLLVAATCLLAAGCELSGESGKGVTRPLNPAPGSGGNGVGFSVPGAIAGGGVPAAGGQTAGLTSCTASGGGGVTGIWVGGVLPDDNEEMRLLIAETGEFRWIPGTGWFQQVSGTFEMDGSNLVSTDAVWTWVDGLYYTETRSEPLDIWGGLDEQGRLVLEYQFDKYPTLAGSYTLTACDSVYRRESSLEIVAGAYSDLDANYSLAIDSVGEIFYQSASTGCANSGSVEVIDPAFNIYRATVTITRCTGQPAAPGGTMYTGLGYLGDSGEGFSNDIVEFALSTVGGNNVVVWTLEARR